MATKKLPVGVSICNYFAPKDRVKKEFPIPRISAHITIDGKSYAKHFFPHLLGKKVAIQKATDWREFMVSVAKIEGITTKKLGLAGVRKKKV